VRFSDLASVNVRQSDIKRTIDGIRRHAGSLTLVCICITSIILSHRLAYMSALPGARFAHLCLSLRACVCVFALSKQRRCSALHPDDSLNDRWLLFVLLFEW